MLKYFCVILTVIASLAPPVAATDCPDAGIVVVATVFATLAVVFIVLGIIAFLIWKRRRDISRPEKLQSDDPDKHDISKFGYTNQAFDVEVGEGAPGYVACKETRNSKNNLYNSDRDFAKKTWSSLPATDVPDVRQRKSSLGSLDRNKFASESTEEVWLTSQDFIGLGFNIAGSMRDGIFVSQVHNRGPANESGKFKVGDRIMHVGISFENMVYEDALTILSYASPYPVKVTLQKQQTIPKNRKLSDVRTNLNHPLYRSHSVDALDIHSEKVSYPKRAASEMRYKKNDSPNGKRMNMSFPENSITEEIANGAISIDNEVFEATTPTVDAVIHRVNTDDKDKLKIDREVSVANDSTVPSATLDLTNEISMDGTSDRNVHKESQFENPFENLSEQDKIDMLRLSYADPEVVASFGEKATNGVSDQKGVPMKPERKKKRSSSNSTSIHGESDVQSSPPSTPVQDDVFRPILAPPTEAPPPIPEIEAEEDMILPETKARSVTIGSGNIVLEAVSAVNDQAERKADKLDLTDGLDTLARVSGDGDKSVSGHATSLDVDSNEDPVTEEAITATHIEKKATVPDRTNVNYQNGNIITGTGTNVESIIPETMSQKQEEAMPDNVESKQAPSISSAEAEDAFEKELSELDLNLNIDMDSVLFNELQYTKNEKETENSYAYDISVTELEAMEQKVRDEERKKLEQPGKKGGIAFEIRDDFVTGELRTVNHLDIHRTASYDTALTNNTVKDVRDINAQRPTSFKGDIKNKDENSTGTLEWSGKRLVRSGSFSEIPQDDSVKVWTDNREMTEEDALIEKHIQEDSTTMKKLTRATLVPSKSLPRQDKDYLSDSNSECQSISSSESSDSGDRSAENDNRTGDGDHNEIADESNEALKDNLIDESHEQVFDLSSEKEMSVSRKMSDIISENHAMLENNQTNQIVSVTLSTENDGEEDC